MRKALVVGVNYYAHDDALHGCVDDAHRVKAALERNSDGSSNFEVRLLTGTGPTDVVTRAQLKDGVTALFTSNADVALFYFAGHGYVESAGGYLLGSDARRGDEGLSLYEVMELASTTRVRNKIIILDSCHSGIAGSRPSHGKTAELTDGITVLTASTDNQYAVESNDGGVFTKLLVDALQGGAADLLGRVTPGSVYAHIDQSLGAWGQRPVFKTNVEHFVTLRTVAPPISRVDLQRLPELFPTRQSHVHLDPSFEPEMIGRRPGMPPPDPENTRTFALLQRYNRVNLVVPVDAPHMWHAAMESKSCRLTTLGEHYRRLAEEGRF